MSLLPSVSLGRLAWIDRFPADVLTLVDPRDPATLVQLDVQGEGPATAWIFYRFVTRVSFFSCTCSNNEPNAP